MKILLINKFWREAGGVENHAFEVKEFLESRGHEVIPFAMREAKTLDDPNLDTFPSEVDFRAGSPKQTLKALNRAIVSSDTLDGLASLVRRTKPDAAYVLHVYHQLGPRILNYLERSSIPSVLSIHDYKIACGNYRFFSERTGSVCTKCIESPRGHLFRPITERCWGGSAAAGAALVAESSATRAMSSYSRPRVITTLNTLQERALDSAGIDVPRVRVPHPVALRSSRSNEKRDEFLFVGRIVPEKGLEHLIRAVATAGLRLAVVGDGRSMGLARKEAERTGAQVRFLGSLTHDETLRCMDRALALCVPSVWHEVSPLVVLEAIAADVPVVASALGGMVDQLEGGRGYLLPPHDVDAWVATLREIAQDQDAAQARSSEARQYARRNWQRENWESQMVKAFKLARVSI